MDIKVKLICLLLRTSDGSKEYVGCYDCIKYGFPKSNYKHGQVIQRKDRLIDHYNNHHPNQPVQEWCFAESSSNSKQRNLTFEKVW